jgi:O-antigen/teichoic acid export membrane protein
VSGQSSYRTILRASSIIGGAQVINIAIGLIKMKAAAVLLGPTGVGLVGLYTNLMQTTATVTSLGMANVGTRQIAAAHAAGGDRAVERIRRALFWATLGLALIGALLFWLASGWVARVVLADPARAPQVAWLSLGVALSVATGYQAALLTGMRRVGDLALITIGAGLWGTVLGVGALWMWGEAGLLAMVLIAPAVTLILGHFFVVRLGTATRPATRPVPRLPEMAQDWRDLARLGLPFMLSGVVTLLGHLAARMLVQRDLGPEALGQFQAAWTIGMTYLGFLLGAMSTDFYPRLTAVIHDCEKACRLVNEQTEVALLLCAPVLLVLLGCAPWVIRLLYSAEFGPAIDILRWQLLGDILKLLSWPLGFVILARGMGKTFLLTESLGMVALLAAIWIGIPLVGVTATGIAFLVMYGVYLPLAWGLGGRMIGFRWSCSVTWQALAMFSAAILVFITSRIFDPAGAALGLILALPFSLWALLRLSHQAQAEGRLGQIARATERITQWMKR